MPLRDHYAATAAQVPFSGSDTSYFSAPEKILDPGLFNGNRMHPDVRDWILHTVLGFLDNHFNAPGSWVRVWIAGSGVSYQWSASREPGDLDVLLGVDYAQFRMANPNYAHLSDSQIAQSINELAHDQLAPTISDVEFG